MFLKWVEKVIIFSGRLYVNCRIIFFMSEQASLGPNLNSGSRMPLNGKSRSHPQYRLFTIHLQNFIFPFLPAHSTLNTQDVTGFSGRVDSSLRRQPSSFFVARLEVNIWRGHLNCLNASPGEFNNFNALNDELNPICYLLALLAHHFLHVSRLRVKSLTLRLLMSYIYTWSTYSWCF